MSKDYSPTSEFQVASNKYLNIKSLAGIAGTLKRIISWRQVKNIAREDRLARKKTLFSK